MSSHPHVGSVSPWSNFQRLSWRPQPARLISLGLAVLSAGLVGMGAGLLLGGEPQISVAATPASRPTLKPGSEGDAVKELQATLQLLGVYRGRVDGVYGNETAIAVKQFQRSAGLAADGVVGPATWNRLLPTSTAKAPEPVFPSEGSSANNPPAVSASAPSHGFPVPAGSAPSTSPNPSSMPTVPPPGAPSPAVTPAPKSQPQPVPPATTVAPGISPTAATLPILRRGMTGLAVEGLQTRLQALGVFRGAIDGVFGPETQAAVEAAQRMLQLEPDGVVGPATWIALLKR